MNFSRTIIFLAYLNYVPFGLAGPNAKPEKASQDAHATGDHDHGAEEHHDEVKKDHTSGGHDEHEEEGAGANVGPDKGITSFDEHSGFTLTKEATKNFEIQTARLGSASPWTLPHTALVVTGEDKSVFRMRKERFLRVDVEVLKKDKNQITLRSKNLSLGDEIVVKGAGFLRVAEIDATSGESGHHH